VTDRRPPVGEFEWIARLVEILGGTAAPAGRPEIGDDVARIAGPDGTQWAWTVDTLVEDVHFRFDWLDPAPVGHRALTASLSDLAAGGAGPVGALVVLAGPPATIAERAEGIYRGIGDLARKSGCPILGGDLSRAAGPLHVTATALGRAPQGVLTRSGAEPGDAVWVTGRLGAPAAAIELLAADPAAGRAHAAYGRLAWPEARLDEIAWLRQRAPIHAVIDLSDGLSGDARHVAERSAVRLVLEADRVPIHPAALDAAGPDPARARAWALHGGEEFELLLCAPAGALAPLVEEFTARFDLPLTRIGTVAEGAGVAARGADGETPLEPRSWDHFG